MDLSGGIIMEEKEKNVSRNFIETIIDKDLEEGTYDRAVLTRFPPEPNGVSLSISSFFASGAFPRRKNMI